MQVSINLLRQVKGYLLTLVNQDFSPSFRTFAVPSLNKAKERECKQSEEACWASGEFLKIPNQLIGSARARHARTAHAGHVIGAGTPNPGGLQ